MYVYDIYIYGIANLNVKMCTEEITEFEKWVMYMSNLRIYVKQIIYKYNSLFTDITNLLLSITIVYQYDTIAQDRFSKTNILIKPKSCSCVNQPEIDICCCWREIYFTILLTYNQTLTMYILTTTENRVLINLM